MTEPSDKCGSTWESWLENFMKGSFDHLSKGFFFNTERSVLSKDCHSYIASPFRNYRGKRLRISGEHLPWTLLPAPSSSVPLVTLDLTSQAADRGSELTSAQVMAGRPHSQIRHLACGAQTVDTETHRHNRSRPQLPRGSPSL